MWLSSLPTYTVSLAMAGVVVSCAPSRVQISPPERESIAYTPGSPPV